MPPSPAVVKKPARPVKLISLEADVLRAVLAFLTAKGLFTWRNNNVAVFDPYKNSYRAFIGMRGVSDILGVLPDGRFLAIECKSASGKTTREQDVFLNAVNSRGGIAFVARGMEDVKEHLADYLGTA